MSDLSSLSTAALFDMGEALNVHGRTDADWDMFDLIVAELRDRQDYSVEAPYWMFDN